MKPAPRRSAHRKKRPRRPMVGSCCDAARFALAAEVMRGSPICWSRSTTRPARSVRHFSPRRRVRASSFYGLGEMIARHGLFFEPYMY